MSIQSVKKTLQETINTYNKKKYEIIQNYSNDKSRSPEWKAEQIKIEQDELTKEYLSAVDKIKTELRTAENYVYKNIAKVKYPSSMNDNEAVRVAGELQQNNANLYLMQGQTPEAVLSAIKNAISIGRTDYAFTLIDNAKAKYEGLKHSEEGQRRLRELQEVVDTVEQSGKIKEMEREVSDVPQIAETAGAFQRFVANNYTTQSFYTRQTIQGMTQSEALKNIDSVNASMAVS